MQIREIHSLEEMLQCFPLIQEMYPTITMEEYSSELQFMINHNYTQVVVEESGTLLGLTGLWRGNKLWCGRYIELDNVIVSSQARSKGVGKALFDFVKQLGIDEQVTMLALDSYTHNFKAHKFFYNEGFGPKGFHFIQVINESKLR